MYMYIYVHMYIYICVYIYRERESSQAITGDKLRSIVVGIATSRHHVCLFAIDTSAPQAKIVSI